DVATSTMPSEIQPNAEARAAPAPSGGGLRERSRDIVFRLLEALLDGVPAGSDVDEGHQRDGLVPVGQVVGQLRGVRDRTAHQQPALFGGQAFTAFSDARAGPVVLDGPLLALMYGETMPLGGGPACGDLGHGGGVRGVFREAGADAGTPSSLRSLRG